MFKKAINNNNNVLFSCKAYEDFRKMWLNGSHTAAVAFVSHVMSADDETTIWEESRFFEQQRRNVIVTLQTDA